ncbi:MAG: hypothetical protein ACPGVN_04680, partial [Alphaproteobacteria bacterium]
MEGVKDISRYRNDPRPVPKLQWYLSAGAFLIFPAYTLLVPETNYFSPETGNPSKMQIVKKLESSLQSDQQPIALREFSETLGFEPKPILRTKNSAYISGLL